MVKVKVDAQGRLVLPVALRRRLGLDAGGEVELLTTAEGLVLEQSKNTTVSTGDDGLVVATIDGAGTIRNATVLDAIHAERSNR